MFWGIFRVALGFFFFFLVMFGSFGGFWLLVGCFLDIRAVCQNTSLQESAKQFHTGNRNRHQPSKNPICKSIHFITPP